MSDLQLLSDDSKVTAAALVWTSTTVHNSCITKNPLAEMTLKIKFNHLIARAQVSSCKHDMQDWITWSDIHTCTGKVSKIGYAMEVSDSAVRGKRYRLACI